MHVSEALFCFSKQRVILLRHFTHPFITGQKLADVRGHLEQLQAKFGVHPAGEGHTVLLVNWIDLFLAKLRQALNQHIDKGGELESFVLDAPLYKRRIVIEGFEDQRFFVIDNVKVVDFDSISRILNFLVDPRTWQTAKWWPIRMILAHQVRNLLDLWKNSIK